MRVGYMPSYKIERMPKKRRSHYVGLELYYYRIIIKLPITAMELTRKLITVNPEYIQRKPQAIHMFPDHKYRLRTFLDKLVVDDREYVNYEQEALERNKKNFDFQVKNIKLYAHSDK